ncbi:39S ribosomal protein L28, mitochondrial-like [Patiria miniata]|uniref:Large ribosomal subunit protein bL28m n=1 Tax=Patiria miniata TaxID=46514 RepID=A0A914AH60_PATMI|nr:39S ribosomal protein L28, mitochondrial-like [Patiria miniata]
MLLVRIKMAARSITANISNKLNVIAKNLEKAPKPEKIIFDRRKRPGFYSEGIASRLPPAYFKWKRQPGAKPPVLYWNDPGTDWAKHPRTGERVRTNRVPLNVIYPKHSQLGLWSGEGYVPGFRKANITKGVRVRKCWKPLLQKKELYSEILDQSFTITVSLRTLDLIDEAYGFDFYILKTPPEVLNSLLGMALKRHMLLRLAEKEKVYPNDPDKRDTIYKRYKDFVIPKEEAEWVGLTRYQAIAKQRRIESKQDSQTSLRPLRESPAFVRPLQEVFTEQLIAELKEEQPETSYEFAEGLQHKSRPLISRIFGRGSTDKDDKTST